MRATNRAPNKRAEYDLIIHYIGEYFHRRTTYLLCLFEAMSIVHPIMIKYMQDGSKRDSEEDSEYTTESSSDEGHNEDIE